MGERLEKHSEKLSQDSQSEKTQQTADPRPHSVELDALRGIGVLGVVLTHSIARWDNVTGNPLNVPLSSVDLLDLFRVLGPFSLTLFFLLSGYLLSGTESMRASRGNYSLRSYAFRRALRLIPAYYVALAVNFLLWPGEHTLGLTLLHLTVLQSFAPESLSTTAFDPAYWYLTSELVFYALLPLLVLKIRGLYGRLTLFGALVTMGLAIEIYIHVNIETLGETYNRYLFQFPLTHLWLFMAGVLLRMLVERLDERSLGGSRSTVAFLLFVVPLALLALVPYVSFPGGLMTTNNTIASNIFTNLLAISFLAGALLGSPVLSKILSWRLLGFIGMISYSLYLLHGTVVGLSRVYVLRSAKPLLKNLDGVAVWLVFAGYLGAILVVAGAIAYLSFRYIESPFLRYKPK